MGFIILGGFLILLPILLIIFMLTQGPKGKGFGDRWTGSENFAFWLLFLAALTRGFLLFTPMIVGLLLLAYGIARVTHASLPLTWLYEGIAVAISLLFFILWRLQWWISKKKQPTAIVVPPPSSSPSPTANPRPLPRVITPEQAPPLLLLNTPYTFDKLTLTVHSYRKRQSFRPIPNRFQPGYKNQDYPETWFIEFDCTVQNTASEEIDVWTHVEEILPENSWPHPPRFLRQFLPLSEDENMDIVAGSRVALFPKQHTHVKTMEECKFFFRLDASMNLHTMAFFLHTFSLNTQQSADVPLFSVEV